VRQLLYAACFFEAGLLLVVLPWTVFWDRNYWFDALPLLHAVSQSPYLRGAISGLGVLNVGIGVVEIAEMVNARFAPGRQPGLAPPTDAR
jgi:hypothetical protein